MSEAKRPNRILTLLLFTVGVFSFLLSIAEIVLAAINTHQDGAKYNEEYHLDAFKFPIEYVVDQPSDVRYIYYRISPTHNAQLVAGALGIIASIVAIIGAISCYRMNYVQRRWVGWIPFFSVPLTIGIIVTFGYVFALDYNAEVVPDFADYPSGDAKYSILDRTGLISQLHYACNTASLLNHQFSGDPGWFTQSCILERSAKWCLLPLFLFAVALSILALAIYRDAPKIEKPDPMSRLQVGKSRNNDLELESAHGRESTHSPNNWAPIEAQQRRNS